MVGEFWLSAADPQPMLHYLRDASSARKHRLFACACCRLRWPAFDEPRRRLLRLIEDMAEGMINRAEIDRVWVEIRVESSQGVELEDPLHYATQDVPACSIGSSAAIAYRHADRAHTDRYSEEWQQYKRAELKAHCHLAREVFGNPFLHVRLHRSSLDWQDGTIPKLAQAAYDERELPSGQLDPARLAVLADALEEAGCANEDILTHLRGPGPHVRGCWVVDLLLGKV